MKGSVMDHNQEKINMHEDFWARKSLGRPLVSFQLKEYMVGRRFSAAQHLLVEGKELTPDLLNVDELISDYERMYAEACKTGQDAFWVAEPFNGIPWMEGIFGCKITGANDSFVAHPFMTSVADLKKIAFTQSNPWFRKYIEFVTKITKFAEGRFPVGQPILRGVSDVVGTMIGQTNLIFALMEEPEILRDAFYVVAEAQKALIKAQYQYSADFLGGHALGFYHVWCPGRCIWFQEDLSALFSPDLYDQHIKEIDQYICNDYEYTMMHLHPASFFIIDSILEIDQLKAIQINKDIGGPTIKEMLPTLQKVLKKKNLILFAELDEKEIDLIFKELPSEGLFLNIFAPTAVRAAELMEKIKCTAV